MYFYPRPPGGGRLGRHFMSIARADYFYPRPPGGGRRQVTRKHVLHDKISIHALRVEGDCPPMRALQGLPYFYPRPPGGGRRIKVHLLNGATQFLSTPSGWRATAKTDKVFICFCAKGRRNCLFKTRKEKICRWRFKKDKFWVLIWCEGSGKSVCALASHCG